MESSSDTDETVMNKRKYENCGLKDHNTRTCSSFVEYTIEVEFINELEANTNKRKCGNCSLENYNTQTCPSLQEYTDVETSNVEDINKRKCRICGISGHNVQTCPS
ncbi:17973_t:CDS:1 [Dentiscutata erythropus]|uniref:17973_t:CDS:1 n=1 Tax=Dentiscutata erythropus TaxID=1348616 RepID=A0A9N9GCI0_9GLOM|nr:17973_t:CDS:1 [Dentiscutata erythropus]